MKKIDELKKDLRALKDRLLSNNNVVVVQKKRRTKLDKLIDLVDRKKRDYILSNVTKDVINKLDVAGTHFCNDTNQMMHKKVCIARVFLKDHPHHKLCDSCIKFDKYYDDLVKEIKK